MRELVMELLEEFGEVCVSEVVAETGALPENVKAFLRTIKDVTTDDYECWYLFQ